MWTNAYWILKQQQRSGQPPSSDEQYPVFSHSIGAASIGFPCMLTFLCTVAVIGRLAARQISKAIFGADDYIAILALFILFALTIEEVFVGHFVLNLAGAARPNIHDLQGLGKMELATQLTYNFLITAARLSILMLYRRIFSLSKRWFRIGWWFCMIMVILLCIAIFTLFITQCSPHNINLLWLDPAKCRPTKGFTENKGPSIAGFINAFVDLCVLILPVKMVWALHMSTKRKIGVHCVFLLGLVGVAVSIARAATQVDKNSKPGSGNIAIAIWSFAEAAVALLCACLPMMRPLFARAHRRISQTRESKTASNRMPSADLASRRSRIGQANRWASVEYHSDDPFDDAQALAVTSEHELAKIDHC